MDFNILDSALWDIQSSKKKVKSIANESHNKMKVQILIQLKKSNNLVYGYIWDRCQDSGAKIIEETTRNRKGQ